MARPPVAVTVATCLGVQPEPGDRLALVFQRPDGALHVVEMPEATALAAALAIRTGVRPPPCGPEIVADPDFIVRRDPT